MNDFLEVTDEIFEEQLARVASQVKYPLVGLYGPDSMMWHASKHVLSSFHGSGRALLLQIAHPWVTQGIDEHSNTRHDPIGRGQRTFRAVFSIVYGSLEQAQKEARRVNRVHTRIKGTLEVNKGAFPEGSKYMANEAHSMLWVHATLWETQILMYELFVGKLSDQQKQQYYQETKLFAYMFGVPEDILPPNWHEFLEYNQKIWESDILHVNAATLELFGFLFKPQHPALTAPMNWMSLVTAATLPEPLREAFGIAYTEKDKKKFERNVKIISRLEPITPKILRYGPNYLEANRRIKGLEPAWLTKKMNKLIMGQEVLVG
jgi:uncharacterized protein (DUF2236 family)